MDEYYDDYYLDQRLPIDEDLLEEGAAFRHGGPPRPRRQHVHQFRIPTSFNFRHRHQMINFTAPSGPGPRHVHAYRGRTTFDDGHVHFYEGVTGPPIPQPGGGHIHFLAGQTSYNMRHNHNYRGATGRNQPLRPYPGGGFYSQADESYEVDYCCEE